MIVVKYIGWRLLNFVFRVINPMFWIQNYDTCYYWDQKILELMKKETPRFKNHTIFLGEYEIWVKNYPYAYGRHYEGVDSGNPLPSPITRVMLKSFINRAKYGLK